jgi:hypothetical protein
VAGFVDFFVVRVWAEPACCQSVAVRVRLLCPDVASGGDVIFYMRSDKIYSPIGATMFTFVIS